MERDRLEAEIKKLRWYHDWELLPGLRTGGTNNVESRSHYFGIPEDLTGKSVLDIGCAEGYYSFLAESRGATVVSIDACPRQGYFLAHEALRSKATFRHLGVMDLTPENLGTFDVVLFFGVYYHLKNPLYALERIARVTREMALIESEIIPPEPAGAEKLFSGLYSRISSHYSNNLPLSRFQEQDAHSGDLTSWWVPNYRCLEETVRAAGFPRVELLGTYRNSRGVIRASKGPRTSAKNHSEDIIIYFDPLSENEKENAFELTGYAFDQLSPEGGIEEIVCYLDSLDDPDNFLAEAHYGIERPDLLSYFTRDFLHTGFRLRFDADSLEDDSKLYVLAVGPKSWNYRVLSASTKRFPAA